VSRTCVRLSRVEHANFRPCFNNQKQYWERYGTNLQWKTHRRTLPGLTANITEKWLESYGNWLVSFVLQARAKSCLTLLCVTSEEPIAWTREAPLA
jgi:hypothetical protein